jgi:hypothetical protein
MPAGDAQRVWFPEMLSELHRAWSAGMSWEDLGALCARVTEMRREIRRSRGILPPLTRCPACGRASRADIAGVSVRSALFALAGEGLVTEAEFRRLDRDWMKHRATLRLDPYGRTNPPSQPADPERCRHP